MSEQRALTPLRFVLFSTIAQAAAAALVWLVWAASGTLSAALALGALLAFAMAHLVALPLPWQFLNLILPPAIATTLAVELPPTLFLLLLCASLCVYAPALWSRVPYYPTTRSAYGVLLAQLPSDRPCTFIDLGCGSGELLLFLAQHRPLGRFIGVEVGILPWLLSTVRARLWGRGRVLIYFRSIWSVDLSQYDFVYAFLSPAPMERLWQKVQAELNPNATFISNSFPAPATPSERISLKNNRGGDLFLYKPKNVSCRVENVASARTSRCDKPDI
jgi:hypothetical protein